VVVLVVLVVLVVIAGALCAVGRVVAFAATFFFACFGSSVSAAARHFPKKGTRKERRYKMGVEDSNLRLLLPC
jgi:hypothetical protein